MKKTRTLRPRARDLFGQVPVTLDEIRQWVKNTAPHMLGSEWRYDYYVKGWNVADKIRAAKIDGSFWKG